MTEESTNSAESTPPPSGGSTPPPSGGSTDPNNPYGYPMEDVEEGKLFAILSYIIPFVFIVPLIQKDNNFALFHAKQMLLLMIASIPVAVVSMVLSAFLCGIPFFLFILAAVAYAIIGLVFAIQGQYKPLLFIGEYAEEWFKTIKVEK